MPLFNRSKSVNKLVENLIRIGVEVHYEEDARASPKTSLVESLKKYLLNRVSTPKNSQKYEFSFVRYNL